MDEIQKLDALWKRLNYGVAQTSLNKLPYEENEKSPIAILSSDIWQQDDLIPDVPTNVPNVVQRITGKLVRDPSEPVSLTTGLTFFAIKDHVIGLTPENRARDFISFTKAPAYEVKIYADDQLTDRIYPNDAFYGWYFDYSAGILRFPNGSDRTITELYVDGYIYIGDKGVGPIFTGDTVDVIMTPTSGSYDGGYVESFVSNTTTIADAVDLLNKALNDFKPISPANISQFNFYIPGSSGSYDTASIVLAESFTDNSGPHDMKPVAGSPVVRVVGNLAETNVIGPFDGGREGGIGAFHNGVNIGSTTLTPGPNDGIYGCLQILEDRSYPIEQPGFNESLTVRAIDVPLIAGLNHLYIEHSLKGSSNPIFFVKDSIVDKPSINSIQVEVDNEVITYSSGIPHYDRGTKMRLGADVNTVATDLMLTSKHLVFDTVPTSVGNKVWSIAGQHNLPEILTRNAGYVINDIAYEIDDEFDILTHKTVQFKATAQNTNGKTEQIHSTKINVMRDGISTTSPFPIKEYSVPIENLGELVTGTPLYAYRIYLGDGSTPYPEWEYGTSFPTVWISSDELPANEAAVMGGSIVYVNQNLATYLPAGPDFSDRTGDQYITFAIHRNAVSNMKIEITGKYSGLLFKLPSDKLWPYISNGWINAFESYQGYGTPGMDTIDGCAMGKAAFGGTQDLIVTFGRESSSNSFNNLILVRFIMRPGDEITGLRFSGV